MGWFTREKAPKPQAPLVAQNQIPDDTWTKCPRCASILFTKDLTKNEGVCLKCNYYFRLTVEQRISLIVDKATFEEFDTDLKPGDPLSFKDKLRYKDRIKKAEKTSGNKEAFLSGKASVTGVPIGLGLFNFNYMAGSMGSVVGEKIARLFERAVEQHLPVVVVSASGGARMQEGIFSLMQMAKVSAAIARHSSEKLPYISLLTDPTTGGVAASLAMQGDVIIAEPEALIGFAGPRVIQQTIRQQLPAGFQRSEFLFDHGMIDRIVNRDSLRSEIGKILKNFGFPKESGISV
jgi:acetyl-CoA carboxylase carboxyl transferase subunit beta